jgi:hypothetical protein
MAGRVKGGTGSTSAARAVSRRATPRAVSQTRTPVSFRLRRAARLPEDGQLCQRWQRERGRPRSLQALPAQDEQGNEAERDATPHGVSRDCLQPPRQQENDQDQYKQPKPPTREVTPATAVRPQRQRAD